MLFANNCNTTLNGGITAIATSMVVTSATGFPAPTGSQYFYCTLADAATQTTIEIVKVTAVSGTTFTIVRGQDGTSGTIFASGAVVSLRLVRASLQDFPLLDEANTFTFAPTFNTALAVGSGGTGLTTLTAGYIPYGNGTSAFASSSALQFNSGNLGVSTAPSTWSLGNAIELGASGSGLWSTGSANIRLVSNLTYNGGYLYSSTAAAAQLYVDGGRFLFYTAPSGTAGTGATLTQAMTLFNSGGVSIGNTTDPGAGVLYVSSGVRFPATQSASTDVNTLDDYEEGTWTPTDASGAGLTLTITYATYTKIGNTVFAKGYIAYPVTANTANATITLPFTAVQAVIGNGLSTSVSGTACCLSNGGAAQLTFRNSNFTNITNAALSGATILFSITYTV